VLTPKGENIVIITGQAGRRAAVGRLRRQQVLLMTIPPISMRRSASSSCRSAAGNLADTRRRAADHLCQHRQARI
jgi:hypothetical protein